jgi:hypothetical protein
MAVECLGELDNDAGFQADCTDIIKADLAKFAA